jgi:putative exporter of polyketide antibiotics
VKLALVAGATFPVASLLAATFGFMSFDMALSAISVMFIIALVPGIVENYRRKIGWSKQSTVMTAFGLLSMGIMFTTVGLRLTGLLTILSGATWVILAVQSFVYEGPT